METRKILKELLKNATTEYGYRKASHHEFHDVDFNQVESIGLEAENERYVFDECVKWENEPILISLWDKEMEKSIFVNEAEIEMIENHIQELWDAKNKELEKEYEDAVYDCNTYEPM